MSAPSVVFAANARYGQGGQGEFLRLMTRALAAAPQATVYSRFVPHGLVHEVNLPFGDSMRARLFHAILAVPVLRRRQDWLTLLSDLDFDARVASAIDPPSVFDGVMAQCATTMARVRRRGTKTVLTCLNTHIHNLARVMTAEYRRVGAPGPSFMHPRMIRRALTEIAEADHIRVNSALARQSFVDEGVPAGKITVIHPGVDLDHFTPVEKKDDVFRVLAVSSIDPRKGVHDLFEAFELAALPNAELVVIGGTGDGWSKALVARYRQRLPNVTVKAVDIMSVPVAETFGRASVLVHAAAEDGYGLVVPQALASGRPVIVTRTSGAAELVVDGRTGFVVGAQAPSEIAERLRQLATDRALWRSMCDAARPSVEHLSYAAFERDVAAMYSRVLGR